MKEVEKFKSSPKLKKESSLGSSMHRRNRPWYKITVIAVNEFLLSIHFVGGMEEGLGSSSGGTACYQDMWSSSQFISWAWLPLFYVGGKKRKQECLASREDVTTQKAVKIKCEWLHHHLFIKLIYVESPIHGWFQIAEGFLQCIFSLLFWTKGKGGGIQN